MKSGRRKSGGGRRFAVAVVAVAVHLGGAGQALAARGGFESRPQALASVGAGAAGTGNHTAVLGCED